MDSPLRDFLYLDIDKTRSLVAQLNQGFPEAIEKATNQQGRLGIDLLGYALERSATETVSIHHHLYSLLEGSLLGKQRVLNVGLQSEKKKAFDWTEESLRDGVFVLAEGNIRILDFASTGAAMAGFPTLLQLFQKLQEQSLKDARKAGTMTQQELQVQMAGLRQGMPDLKQIQTVTEMVTNLYGDALRLRLFPSGQPEEHFFAANLSRTYVQRQASSTAGASGLTSAGVWRLFGILDRFHSSPTSTVTGATNLEDVMLGVIEQFSQLGKFTMAVEWPVVSVIPIAVYRVLDAT